MTSPDVTEPTPLGVPVSTISPGSRVMTWLMSLSCLGIRNSMSSVLSSCLVSPLTFKQECVEPLGNAPRQPSLLGLLLYVAARHVNGQDVAVDVLQDILVLFRCMLTPAGLSTGPSLGRSMEDGGLRKKKGCFGRWLLSSFTCFDAVFAAATRPAARATAGEQNAGLRFGRANAECLRAGIGKDILGGTNTQVLVTGAMPQWGTDEIPFRCAELLSSSSKAGSKSNSLKVMARITLVSMMANSWPMQFLLPFEKAIHASLLFCAGQANTFPSGGSRHQSKKDQFKGTGNITASLTYRPKHHMLSRKPTSRVTANVYSSLLSSLGSCFNRSAAASGSAPKTSSCSFGIFARASGPFTLEMSPVTPLTSFRHFPMYLSIFQASTSSFGPF
ncbi:hypothetical protein KC349_g312 [Hortaea werneckii]|nr:hypothetical protein KC349_g312 [Hortaea werneckii]